MILVGVDPGQAQDPTAISAVQRSTIEAEERRLVRGAEHKRKLERLDVTHCERMPLHTSYPAVIDRVAEVCAVARDATGEEPLVLLDLTGVGRPVRDMMRPRFKRLLPVTITAGHSTTFDQANGEWHVPKRVLVSCVAIALQQRALKISRGIQDAPVLVRELENFKAKITKSGHETFEAWRDGDHDDLVLAMALCVWWASITPGKWNETDIGAEQRVKRDVLARNKARMDQRRWGTRRWAVPR